MLTEEIIGSYRRFGNEGVVYQILDAVDEDTLKIRVLETEEETEYPLENAIKDPTEH